MKINESMIFSEQNKFNKNSAITTIQNKIISKSKEKQKAGNNDINKSLDEIGTSTNGDVTNSVGEIIASYQPIEDTFKSLALNTNLYNQYSNELQNNNLSDDEKVKTQSALDGAKQNILELTSSEHIADLDKVIANYSLPIQNKAITALKGEIGTSLDTNSVLVTSMESLGFTSNKNLDFNEVLDDVKNAENNFYKKTSKLDDISLKYGVNPNEDITKTYETLNTYA